MKRSWFGSKWEGPRIGRGRKEGAEGVSDVQTYQMDDGTEETSKAGSLAAAAAKRKTDMHKIAFSKRFMGREEQTQHACQQSSASLDNFSHVSR